MEKRDKIFIRIANVSSLVLFFISSFMLTASITGNAILEGTKETSYVALGFLAIAISFYTFANYLNVKNQDY